MEESPLVAAAAFIRETRGYNALVQFAQDLGIDYRALFTLLTPPLLGVEDLEDKKNSSNKYLRKRVAKLLVWEGHKVHEIAEMMGSYGSPSDQIRSMRSTLIRIHLLTRQDRVMFQKTNPRIQKLLTELRLLIEESQDEQLSPLRNPETIAKVRTILNTTEISLKELAQMSRCSMNALRKCLKRNGDFLSKENPTQEGSDIACAA